MSDRTGPTGRLVNLVRKIGRKKPVGTAGFDLSGPFEDDGPDDGLLRLDLGSVRLPVPDGAQVQITSPPGHLPAVEVLTELGRFRVTAYAAPPAGGLWEQVYGDLTEQLSGEAGALLSESGDWGQELVLVMHDGEFVERFIGVDGPRWILFGVVAGPPELAAQSASALRDMLRGTVVVRGARQLPDRTPLPIKLPAEMASRIGMAPQDEG